MGKLRIGRHIDINHGFITAPAYARSIDCDIMQIFLGNPQQIISKEKDISQLKKFSEELEKNKMKIIIHGSYTINFCHPKNSKQHKASVKSLVQDLMTSLTMGPRCLGVIIHMGKNIEANQITDKQAMTNYINGLKESISVTPKNTIIILETGASQGHEIGSKMDSLSQIYWGLDEEERSRIKFCIDTCHIWATGYDISNKAGVGLFFKEFDKLIGIDKIACIHYNDSKTKLDSHVDRHADLGFGFIGTAGLREIGHFAKKYKIPLIMETPLDSVNPQTNKDVTFTEELAKIKTWLK